MSMDSSHDWCITVLGSEGDAAGPRRRIKQIASAHGIVGEASAMTTFPVGTVTHAWRLPIRLEESRIPALRDALKALDINTCDAVLHPAELHWSRFKLAVFDLDSTLIACEGIVELAAMMNIGEKVSAITESAMRGEIDFQQSFRKRISLLRGLEESRVRELATSVSLTAGAELLLRTLIKAGYRTAIATGGFDFIASRLQSEIGVHDFCANSLEFSNGRLTGEITTRIIDAEGKAEFVRHLAKRHGIPLSEVVVIGDGANDIPMMRAARLSVAYHAKPKVVEAASCSLSHAGLDGVLYLLQLDGEAVQRLTR
jgi:phosphoserine phosphatase